MRNSAKSWEDENIDFRMAEESEKMLVENWVSSARRVEEGGIEVSVCQKYCDSSGENGEG